MSWTDGAGVVFIVEPPRTRPRASRHVWGLIQEAKAAAASGALPVVVRRAERIFLAGGSGRSEDVLSPTDAAGLYKRLHQEPSLVLEFTGVRIRRNPRRDPPTKRDAITLGQFVRYKAVHKLVRTAADITDSFEEFASWRKQISCHGDGDPRTIPFHIFSTDAFPGGLASPQGRARFDDRYGTGASRIDDEHREWARASRRAFHGRGERHVAGKLLPEGMHWDVSGAGKAIQMANAHEVWELNRHRGYLNVYPDGHFRRPSRKAARRIWPKSS